MPFKVGAVASPATITLSSLADADRPAFVASYELIAADPTDQQPLALDFRERPFEPLFVRCSAAPTRWRFRRWKVATGTLPIPLARGATWQGATLEVGMRWKGRDGCPRFIDDPYVRVPEELPALIHWRAPHEFPRPRVVLQSDLVGDLVGYLGAGMNAEAGPRGPHLTAVLRVEAVSVLECPAGSWPEAGVPVTREGTLDRMGAAEICTMLRGMADFLAQRFSARPSLRLAAAVESAEDALDPPGPYLWTPLSLYGDVVDPASAHTVPIATYVAMNWWGTGCVVAGAVGDQVATAIAFAAALSWAGARAPRDYFERMLAKYRARVADVTTGARPMRRGEIHRLLGVPLHDWLSADEARWDALRELTRRTWGSRIDEKAVLDWIADAGLDLRPTFTMAVQQL